MIIPHIRKKGFRQLRIMAERVGFEPTVPTLIETVA